MSAAKEKPVCASYSDRLFRGFILKVQLPPKHDQGQCQSAECQPLQHRWGELVSTSLATPSVWLPPFSFSWIDLSKEYLQNAGLGLILLHWIHGCWVGSECQTFERVVTIKGEGGCELQEQESKDSLPVLF